MRIAFDLEEEDGKQTKIPEDFRGGCHGVKDGSRSQR
jgi:hypothetical protein